jgi:hypothetical protein
MTVAVAIAAAVVAMAAEAEEGTNPCVTFDRDGCGVSIYHQRAIFRRVPGFAWASLELLENEAFPFASCGPLQYLCLSITKVCALL